MKMKMLVVDDKQRPLDQIASYLNGRKGWEFFYKICLTANHALNGIEEVLPDALLTDYTFDDNEPGANTGEWVAQWVYRHHSKIIVGTHTRRLEVDARKIFAHCPNVRHFVGSQSGGINYTSLEEFMCDCESILKTAQK